MPRHYLVGASQKPTQLSEPAIKLSLGWPSGVKAEVSIDSGRISRVLGALWFAPLSQRVHLVGAHVEISVPEDDSGRLQCVLALANFCFRQITVTSIHVDFLTIGNGSLSDFNPHPEQPEFVIPRRGVGEVAFSYRLGAGEIRDLQRFLGQASYPRSSPTASTVTSPFGAVCETQGPKCRSLIFTVAGVGEPKSSGVLFHPR